MISFYLFFNFIFFCSFFIEVKSFVPEGRITHSSVNVDNKWYFFGGRNNDDGPLSEVFYLDLSRPFDADAPSWVDISASSAIPVKSTWASTARSKQSISI